MGSDGSGYVCREVLIDDAGGVFRQEGNAFRYSSAGWRRWAQNGDRTGIALDHNFLPGADSGHQRFEVAGEFCLRDVERSHEFIITRFPARVRLRCRRFEVLKQQIPGGNDRKKDRGKAAKSNPLTDCSTPLTSSHPRSL